MPVFPIVGEVVAWNCSKKWYTKLTISINQEYSFTKIVLLDIVTDLNYIQWGLIPSKYFEKIKEILLQAKATKLNIIYKLSNAHICDNGIFF